MGIHLQGTSQPKHARLGYFFLQVHFKILDVSPGSIMINSQQRLGHVVGPKNNLHHPKHLCKDMV